MCVLCTVCTVCTVPAVSTVTREAPPTAPAAARASPALRQYAAPAMARATEAGLLDSQHPEARPTRVSAARRQRQYAAWHKALLLPPPRPPTPPAHHPHSVPRSGFGPASGLVCVCVCVSVCLSGLGSVSVRVPGLGFVCGVGLAAGLPPRYQAQPDRKFSKVSVLVFLLYTSHDTGDF